MSMLPQGSREIKLVAGYTIGSNVITHLGRWFWNYRKELKIARAAAAPAVAAPAAAPAPEVKASK